MGILLLGALILIVAAFAVVLRLRPVRLKFLSKRPFLMAGFAVIAFSTMAIFFLVPSPSVQGSYMVRPVVKSVQKKHSVPAAKPVSVGYPVRLEIPKINVDAALDYVSFTPQGELGVPSVPGNAAWYDRGPRPGEIGSAVIDGHFGYKDNISAVFDNLNKLQTGDTISVKDDKGASTAFVVRTVQLYSQDQDDSDVFTSSDGKAHLNLITCNGVWNEAQKSYSNRLVVFADEETE